MIEIGVGKNLIWKVYVGKAEANITKKYESLSYHEPSTYYAGGMDHNIIL